MDKIIATPVDGYRGIWYMNQPRADRYRYKYSGGFATYPQQHIPIAIHAPGANKTFFVYGGTTPGKAAELLHMVSYFDHATGTVPRPVMLLNKKTDDAHDNPTLALDANGHLWIFSNAHGTSRPAFIHRSVRPYDITAWERALETNFSYGQPWYLPERGFVFLHTRYKLGRGLHLQTSPDGRAWSQPQALAHIEEGHYQISWPHAPTGRLATAFDFHPDKKRRGTTEPGLNLRTNLYYLETPDGGRTWRTADGRTVPLPVTERHGPALVRDYEAEGLLVYLKDMSFDAAGRPVILFLTSRGFEPGPENGPRTLWTARWQGMKWEYFPVTTCDHNYDHASLYVEPDGMWRVLGPTDPGPQPFSTGGDVALYESRNEGRAWKRVRALTQGGARNHTYVRRPLNAHPDFYALWADGDALKPSASALYFTDRAASNVWRLPEKMTGDTASPQIVG